MAECGSPSAQKISRLLLSPSIVALMQQLHTYEMWRKECPQRRCKHLRIHNNHDRYVGMQMGKMEERKTIMTYPSGFPTQILTPRLILLEPHPELAQPLYEAIEESFESLREWVFWYVLTNRCRAAE